MLNFFKKKDVANPIFAPLGTDEDDIKNRFEELKRCAANEGLQIELAGIGGEYRIDTAFKARLDNPRFLKVGGKYVLVEFSLHQQMMGSDELIFDMQMKGYEVILAHPERYPYMNVNGMRLEQLKNQGVYFQINSLSLGGFYGDEAKHRAFEMLERGWVEFMGTDTHNTMYAQALRDLTHNRKVEKVMDNGKIPVFEQYAISNEQSERCVAHRRALPWQM